MLFRSLTQRVFLPCSRLRQPTVLPMCKIQVQVKFKLLLMQRSDCCLSCFGTSCTFSLLSYRKVSQCECIVMRCIVLHQLPSNSQPDAARQQSFSFSVSLPFCAKLAFDMQFSITTSTTTTTGPFKPICSLAAFLSCKCSHTRQEQLTKHCFGHDSNRNEQTIQVASDKVGTRCTAYVQFVFSSS